jgi:hypothetical protein
MGMGIGKSIFFMETREENDADLGLVRSIDASDQYNESPFVWADEVGSCDVGILTGNCVWYDFLVSFLDISCARRCRLYTLIPRP